MRNPALQSRHARPPYEWSDDDDEVALDAIIVGIASDREVFAAEGLDFGPVVAAIFWPDWINGGDMVKAAMEGPYPVADALERAEILCAQWAYNRVVIAIQSRDLWDDAWGTLADEPGFERSSGTLWARRH